MYPVRQGKQEDRRSTKSNNRRQASGVQSVAYHTKKPLERHAGRHGEDLEPLPSPPIPKPHGMTEYPTHGKQSGATHKWEGSLAEDMPETEVAPHKVDDLSIDKKKAAYHQSDKTKFANLFAEEMPETKHLPHNELITGNKKSAIHESDKRKYFAEEFPASKDSCCNDDEPMLEKKKAAALDVNKKKKHTREVVRYEEEAVHLAGTTNMCVMPGETPSAESPSGHEIATDNFEGRDRRPGAFRLGGFQNSEIDAEEGFSVTVQDTTTPTPEGIESQETLVLAAKVARSESDVAKEARRHMMEEAQVADVLPPEKFFSFKNRKLMIILAGIVLVILGLVLVLTLGFQKDNGSDPEPPFRADLCITMTDDGSNMCVKENFPRLGFSMSFLNCPSTDEERVLECAGPCAVADVPVVNDWSGNPNFCNGCILCGGSLGYDCTNLLPDDDDCALTDCSGECGKDPLPSPSAMTQPDYCDTDNNTGSYFCGKKDVPAKNLWTLLEKCPPGTADDNFYACQKCGVVHNDWIENDEMQCNSCINCGDSFSYDCSNLFPEEECAIRDCNGECYG